MSEESSAVSFMECFSEREDPRIDRKKLYPLKEILLLVICATLCGAESYSLHWVLDMTFREDESRIRCHHAPENMSMVRHIALNMLRNARKKFKDVSIKGLRKKAGWGNATLDLILAENF